MKDAPEGPTLDADFWAHARIVEPRGKKSVHLRVDADVLDFFKAQGKGHLTRMNAVLKAYADAHRKS
ncbi:MAG TPA: BrnA antitoxin family protein [Pararhizobium sp.]|nr:BrnA antitoxin family protein [Pararhizobium sp.]